MNLAQLTQPRCEECNKKLIIDPYEGTGYYDEQASFWERRPVYHCEACAEKAFDDEIAALDAQREWPIADND